MIERPPLSTREARAIPLAMQDFLDEYGRRQRGHSIPPPNPEDQRVVLVTVTGDALDPRAEQQLVAEIPFVVANNIRDAAKRSDPENWSIPILIIAPCQPEDASRRNAKRRANRVYAGDFHAEGILSRIYRQRRAIMDRVQGILQRSGSANGTPLALDIHTRAQFCLCLKDEPTGELTPFSVPPSTNL